METKTKKKTKGKVEKKTETAVAGTKVEKSIGTRGKTFEGVVIKKFHKRLVIEFERMIYIRKYERYAKSRTRVHARLPEAMEKEINKGDLVRIKECRPLSKIIHFIVTEKLKDAEEVHQ